VIPPNCHRKERGNAADGGQMTDFGENCLVLPFSLAFSGGKITFLLDVSAC